MTVSEQTSFKNPSSPGEIVECDLASGVKVVPSIGAKT